MTPNNCEKYKQSNPDVECDCNECVAEEKALTELKSIKEKI